MGMVDVDDNDDDSKVTVTIRDWRLGRHEWVIEPESWDYDFNGMLTVISGRNQNFYSKINL